MWLNDAMIVNPCYNSTDPNVGLNLNSDYSTRKCYLMDTGLLVTQTFMDGSYTDKDGEEALKNAMFILSLTNDGINRYIADAIAEKLVREESESALEKMKEDDE